MDPMMNSLPHDDADQDKEQTLDLIKQTLMKVIDDMTQMEADRHLPDGHPKKMVAIKAEVKPEDDMATPDASDEDNPGMLDTMLGTADQADEDGSLPEDNESDLPDSVMAAIKDKKKPLH